MAAITRQALTNCQVRARPGTTAPFDTAGPLVMVREGGPSTPFSRATPQGVASPAMTMGGARLASDDAVGPGRALSRVSPDRRPVNVTGWIKHMIRLWRLRIRERHSFDFVDDRELRDLGLSRWDVEREIVKPFWRG